MANMLKCAFFILLAYFSLGHMRRHSSPTIHEKKCLLTNYLHAHFWLINVTIIIRAWHGRLWPLAVQPITNVKPRGWRQVRSYIRSFRPPSLAGLPINKDVDWRRLYTCGFHFFIKLSLTCDQEWYASKVQDDRSDCRILICGSESYLGFRLFSMLNYHLLA